MPKKHLSDNAMRRLLDAGWTSETLASAPGASLHPAPLDVDGLAAPLVYPRSVARADEGTKADYVVHSEIGKGGMGVVWDAEQTYMHRRVALKMLRPELLGRPDVEMTFFREALLTSKLSHTAIPEVLDFGMSQDKRPLYAMTLAKGTPWDKALPLMTQEANLRIWSVLADAAEYAHSRGVLHLDIKPANVILGRKGEVWLADWGLARQRQLDGTWRASGPCGTPQYLPPEMARGAPGWPRPACDVYLLGAVLWEILTGNPPHPGATAAEALHHATKNAISNTDAAHGALERIALRAMQTDPGLRWPTARALAGAVTAAVGRRRLFRRVGLAAAGAALAVCGAAAGWTLRGQGQTHLSAEREKEVNRAIATANEWEKIRARNNRLQKMAVLSLDLSPDFLSGIEYDYPAGKYYSRKLFDEQEQALGEILKPVTSMLKKGAQVKNDEEAAAVFETLAKLRPQLQQQRDAIERMMEADRLHPDAAKKLLRRVDKLLAAPDTYIPEKTP